MTWSDPIVDEVRQARDAYAARFNYDLQAIFRDLKEQEKRGGRQIVSYAEDDLQFKPDNAVIPTRTSGESEPLLGQQLFHDACAFDAGQS